jgi:hypothetical protein
MRLFAGLIESSIGKFNVQGWKLVNSLSQKSRADFSHGRAYHPTAHVPTAEAPSGFAKHLHVHSGSGFQPTSIRRDRKRVLIANPDVLIRIKRNLNNAEEATRSTTLGADLTHVASLAESFSQLRSRTSAVKADLVDALDREGQVLSLPTFSNSPGLTQVAGKRTNLIQASIFGMLLAYSPQARRDDDWWPAVSIRRLLTSIKVPLQCCLIIFFATPLRHTLPQKVRHAGFRLIMAGLEETPTIESPTEPINVLPLS